MEKVTYSGKILEIVEQEVSEGGKKKIFEVARRSPGVRIIALEEGKVLLTKEFRHELGSYDYRLPGGKVFDTLAEYNQALQGGGDIQAAAEKAAHKEAKEELGIESASVSFFHKSVCGATVVWDLFYFIAEGFTRGAQELGDGEDIAVEAVPTSEAEKMCLDGRISEERSALVLLRYLK